MGWYKVDVIIDRKNIKEGVKNKLNEVADTYVHSEEVIDVARLCLLEVDHIAIFNGP